MVIIKNNCDVVQNVSRKNHLLEDEFEITIGRRSLMDSKIIRVMHSGVAMMLFFVESNYYVIRQLTEPIIILRRISQRYRKLT